jgi:hypothetical protein
MRGDPAFGRNEDDTITIITGFVPQKARDNLRLSISLSEYYLLRICDNASYPSRQYVLKLRSALDYQNSLFFPPLSVILQNLKKPVSPDMCHGPSGSFFHTFTD